ncbi:MAG TPA: hypothetical protein VMM79_14640 [Longimicrobiales bacterium]|nr:hypothetical protein [Longimicrobiales bacterium]
MRRFIVAVVLMAGGWSQQVAIQCPVGQSSHHAEDGATLAYEHDSTADSPSHAEHPDAPAGRHAHSGHLDAAGMRADTGPDTGHVISVPESGHEPADCQFTMRCASPALNSSLTPIHAALELVRADLRAAAAAFSTTLLTHDPPPPRLPV